MSTNDNETTGRSVIVFGDGACGDREAIARALGALAGITNVIGAADIGAGRLDPDGFERGQAIAFETLGIAVVARDPDVLRPASASPDARAAIVAIEPERVLHAIEAEPAPVDTFADDADYTWGLRATGVDAATATGRGIRVAILDTGLDLEHPDYAGRAIESRSFVAGQLADDAHGHGTHCVGSACGPADPETGPRYGVAPEAEIFVGKVLNDSGSGTDTSILAGIEWAITSGCHVISMSLGANLPQVSTAYETVGRRALEAGALIVAAAGNNARRRSGDPGFVGVPANSPSIMAVAALDSGLQIADFSARSNPVPGGQIDIAGPGVAVYSSWPLPRRYNAISGTSMATPHVAGLAALWSEATGATAQALWDQVVEAARALSLPAVDAGAGLALAPAPVEPAPVEPAPVDEAPVDEAP